MCWDTYVDDRRLTIEMVGYLTSHEQLSEAGRRTSKVAPDEPRILET
jgi:hypothetical protein